MTQYETSDYGRSIYEPHRISDKLQSQVDAELQRLVSEAEKVTIDIISKNKKKMDAVVEKLLEVETLEAEEFAKVVGVDKVKRPLENNGLAK